MLIRELPGFEKPREKMALYGPEGLTTGELLAIILRTGTKDCSSLELAQRLLSLDERGIRYLGECSLEELAAVNGIGPVKACQILAAIELGKRNAVSQVAARPAVTSAEDVASLVMEQMRYYKKEHFKLLLLNVKAELISIEDISMGDLSSTVVHPREIFAPAIKRSAAAVILVHNHPSGNPEPSADDIHTTMRIVDAGSILGINVMDHVIIGDGKFASLKSMGRM